MVKKVNENEAVATDPTLIGRIYKGDYATLKDDIESVVARKVADKIKHFKQNFITTGFKDEK